MRFLNSSILSFSLLFAGSALSMQQAAKRAWPRLKSQATVKASNFVHRQVAKKISQADRLGQKAINFAARRPISTLALASGRASLLFGLEAYDMAIASEICKGKTLLEAIEAVNVKIVIQILSKFIPEASKEELDWLEADFKYKLDKDRPDWLKELDFKPISPKFNLEKSAS